jgi:hypothetical protein
MDPEKLEVDMVNDGLKTAIVGSSIIVFTLEVEFMPDAQKVCSRILAMLGK